MTDVQYAVLYKNWGVRTVENSFDAAVESVKYAPGSWEIWLCADKKLLWPLKVWVNKNV